MPRPSTNLDRKMIEAGKKIIIKEGSDALTVRNVCKYAKVNLGMFNYHFKEKEKYLHLLYTDIRHGIEEFIDIGAVKDRPALERLRYVFLKIGAFSKREKKLFSALFLDGMMRRKNHQFHMQAAKDGNGDLLIKLIEDVKKEGHFKTNLPTIQIFALLMMGGVAPELFSDSLGDLAELSGMRASKDTDDFLSKRIDIILKGLEG